MFIYQTVNVDAWLTQAIQERARSNKEKDQHPHMMGRAGYTGRIQQWRDQGLLTRVREDGTRVPIESVEEANRTQMYLLGRMKKTQQGQWIFPSKETAELAEKIVSN